MALFNDAWSFGAYVLPFVFVLSVVVFFHELGHFFVGRWCGVKVDAFSLGLGPELAHFVDRRGTRWRLAALPLGGYVKFHGDAQGAIMSRAEQAEHMTDEERRTGFFTQPVWKRMAIVAAGPIANFALAVAIFAGIAMVYGRGELTPRVQSVRAGEAGEIAGFLPGDLVVSIDGTPIATWSDLQRKVQVSADIPLTFIVARGGVDVTLTVKPRLRVVKSAFGESKIGLVGLEATTNPNDFRVVRYGPVDATRIGVEETGFVIGRTAGYISGLFVGRESTENMSGPIGTAVIAGEVAKAGFSALLNLAAVLSVSIGLINLVPIPLLDGGHLLYYVVEALKGRPLSERAQEVGFKLGIAFVASLMVFATFNDIMHIFRA
jgi:regulator of sigma E protease